MALFAFLYFAALVAVVIYALMLLGRMANAQEETARHLLEIARDLKAVAPDGARRDDHGDRR